MHKIYWLCNGGVVHRPAEWCGGRVRQCTARAELGTVELRGAVAGQSEAGARRGKAERQLGTDRQGRGIVAPGGGNAEHR